jgi:hypothetical protein
MAKAPQALQPIVNVAPLGQLNVYVVHEHEIDTFASGSPGSILLDISFALLAFSGGTLVSITTGTFASDRLFFGVFSAFLVSLVAGLICLLVGIRLYRGNKALVNDIKNRMPPQGTPAVAPAAPAAALPLAAPLTAPIDPEAAGPPVPEPTPPPGNDGQ